MSMSGNCLMMKFCVSSNHKIGFELISCEFPYACKSLAKGYIYSLY